MDRLVTVRKRDGKGSGGAVYKTISLVIDCINLDGLKLTVELLPTRRTEFGDSLRLRPALGIRWWGKSQVTYRRSSKRNPKELVNGNPSRHRYGRANEDTIADGHGGHDDRGSLAYYSEEPGE